MMPQAIPQAMPQAMPQAIQDASPPCNANPMPPARKTRPDQTTHGRLEKAFITLKKKLQLSHARTKANQ